MLFYHSHLQLIRACLNKPIVKHNAPKIEGTDNRKGKENTDLPLYKAMNLENRSTTWTTIHKCSPPF